MPEWRLLTARMGNATHRFSTPNTENTQSLLLGLGYDPLPDWTLTVDDEVLTPDRPQQPLNEWLKVRHAIAHGDRYRHREDDISHGDPFPFATLDD